MWKQLVVTILIALLILPAGASAQGGTFLVWQTLSSAPRVGQDVQAEISSFAGSTEVLFMDAPILLESLLAASQSGSGPDLILASNSEASPLRQSTLLDETAMQGGFFLEDLLDAFPDLAQRACGGDALAACLWPDAAAAMPLEVPQPQVISFATSALCEASPWLPLCDGAALTMASVGWSFDLYLIDSEWLAENGIDDPVNADQVLDLRSEYAIRILPASPGNIPDVYDANFPSVFAISSTLLLTDPDAVMESLTTYYDEDYLPVVSLNVYGLYVSNTAADKGFARTVALDAAGDIDAKTGMLSSTGLVPALSPDELLALDPGDAADETIIRYTLQSMALLTTFAALGY